MKKFLALTLAFLMVLALCACGDKAEETVETAAEAAPAVDAAPAVATEGEAGDATGEMGDASGEMGGAQAGNFLDLSINVVIPDASNPEAYSADEAGWKQYMLDCAYYAMGTSDGDNKLGSTYYDIMNDGMTDMFVSMWGVDDQATFIANGGNPTVQPWSLSEGLGTPETVPDATEE